MASKRKRRTKKRKLIKDLTRMGQRVRSQRLKVNSPLWRRKALALWSFIVRGKGVCDVCQADDVTKLDAHHVLPKERYQWWAFAPVNGVCLCKQCHKIGRFSAHRNPLWFAMWMRVFQRAKYDWAIKHVMEDPRPIPDFKVMHDYLLKRIYELGLGQKFEAIATARAERNKARDRKNKADAQNPVQEDPTRQ